MYAIRRTVPYAFFIPFVQKQDFDSPKDSIYCPPENESGKDRLRAMFLTDKYGTFSPELSMVIQATMTSAFMGFVIGGYVRSRQAYVNFLEHNEATKFASHLDAKRKLQDAVYLNFCRGGARWCWKISLFTCSYMSISTAISVYRGKSAIREYAIAGAGTGFLFKFNMGFRGALVGTALGAILGTLGGTLTYLLLKFSGRTMEEVRYWHYTFRSDQKKAKDELYKSVIQREDKVFREMHAEALQARSSETESTEEKDVLAGIVTDESKK